MAEALVHAQTPPKFVRVYHDAKTKRAFVGTVWLKDVPGALAAAAGALASTGVNLVGSSSSTVNGTGYAEWGFFAEVDNEGLTRDSIIRRLRRIPQITRFELDEGKHGLVVDSIHYPLRFNTGQQGLIVSRSTFSRMLAHMREVFGSGGNVIAYQLGFSTGEEDAEELLSALGKQRVLENLSDLVKLYLALGWGIPRLFNLRLQPVQATLRISDSFECAGVRASRPNSHFLRGHLAGMVKAILDKNVECLEVRCSATGSDFCEFHLVEV